MFYPAALKLDFAHALNQAVPRASVTASVMRSVLGARRSVPADVLLCSALCSEHAAVKAKILSAQGYCLKNELRQAAKKLNSPVIAAITEETGPSRPDHDSFVTRPSGCRHRANRIAKRLLRRGCFAAI
jgi:hypothetical protein